MRGSRRDDLPLSSYAIIGDGRTAALVANDGSVDWLCFGRFDGPPVLCRLLDAQRGGYLQVAPESQFRASRHYLGDTNVLVTELECAAGTLRMTDFMSLGSSEAPVLLRKLEAVAGDVPVRVEFFPTFDFAREHTVVELTERGCLARAGDARMFLSCPAPMRLADGGAMGAFRIRSGEKRWVVLTHGTSPLEPEGCERALESTIDLWEQWSARGWFPGPYANLLRRSALALKLLIHAPTGAMVAAPTTSLPEAFGGTRNWDYRFTWLRDASWLVSALMDLGYHDESMAFIDWLEALDLGQGTPSVFYDLDGRVPKDEHELAHLHGYRSSRPVRVGNAAAGQDQHDVFGEVVSAIHMCSEAMPSMRPLRPGLWNLITAFADRATAHWEHADHGMWEVRDRPRHFLSSKLLSWVALDRALAIARRDGLQAPVERWRDARDRARHVILFEGFDPALGSFRRALDERELDATALLLPRYGLVSASDPRLVQTAETIRRHLSAGDGLIRRYVAEDGLPGSEGAFTACSFWLVDCLARQQRLDEARAVFECVTSHASDLGLLSEEIWPATGELLGNYPQAFTHLALIRAATSIARAEARAASRPKAHRPRPSSQSSSSSASDASTSSGSPGANRVDGGRARRLRRGARVAFSEPRHAGCASGGAMNPNVVVITGASSGVGRAIARAFGDEGARVALIARGIDGLEAAAREVRDAGGDALVLPLDVSDAARVDKAAEDVMRRWGRIDVWINNAMVSVFSPVAQTRADEYRRVMDVNFLGYVHGTLAALRHMRPRNEGVILQIGSALAYRSIPLQSAYCASKAAIRGFTDSLRSELIRERSRVAICMLHLPAVNTPQFDVVRNRLGAHPQPVPPIYQPEVIAQVALRAVVRPRREIWIGWSTTKAIVGQRLIPGLLDQYLAKNAWESQTTKSLPAGHPLAHHEDNIDKPLPGDRGAHGPFDRRARTFSTQRWVRRHVGLLGLGCAVVAGTVWSVRRARR